MKIFKTLLCLILLICVGTNVVFAENLMFGSHGEEVKKVQEKLISKGYDVGMWGADGFFGKGTKIAVKKFQRANGICPDGVVGPATKKALGLNSKRSMRLGDSGKDVYDMQITLMRLGCYMGGAKPYTGNFEKSTEHALKNFQKSNYINADGIAGPETQKKLSSPFASRCMTNILSGNYLHDLGKGYKMRVDPPDSGAGKPHFHILDRNGNPVWVENVDGTPSHTGRHKEAPPDWVLGKARNHPKVRKEREKLTNNQKDVGEKAKEVAQNIGQAVDDNKETISAGLAALAVAALIAAGVPVPVPTV